MKLFTQRLTTLLSSLAIIGLVIHSVGAQSSKEHGKVLAQSMCSECHATQSAQLQSPNAYAPPFETIANIRGMSAPALTSMLYSSHRRMPNIILRPHEARAIVSYILTLQDTDD